MALLVAYTALAAAERDPAALIVERAAELAAGEKYAEALKNLDVVLGENPENIDALVLSAECHEGLRKKDKALELYKKAERLLSGLPQPSLKQKAILKKVVVKITELDRDFAAILKLDDEEHRRHLDAARAYAAKENFVHALLEYYYANRIMPTTECDDEYLALSRKYYAFDTAPHGFTKLIAPGTLSEKLEKQEKKGAVIVTASKKVIMRAPADGGIAGLKVPELKGNLEFRLHARIVKGRMLILVIPNTEKWFVIEFQPEDRLVTFWLQKGKERTRFSSQVVENSGAWRSIVIRHEHGVLRCVIDGDPALDQKLDEAAAGFSFKIVATSIGDRPPSEIELSDLWIGNIGKSAETKTE